MKRENPGKNCKLGLAEGQEVFVNIRLSVLLVVKNMQKL